MNIKRIMTALVMMASVFMLSVVMTGCAPRAELAMQEANPDAYAATRGGIGDGMTGGERSDGPDSGGTNGGEGEGSGEGEGGGSGPSPE